MVLDASKQWNVISLGGGVQSSTMALMATLGELTPMPDFAVFADTGDEPQSVYDWLDYLIPQLAFPVYIAKRRIKGEIVPLSQEASAMRITQDGRRYSRTNIPFFTSNNVTGQKGKITHRSCTADFKIKPIEKLVREKCHVKRGTKIPVVRQWIGISLDEMTRMKPSRNQWSVNVWPLIAKRFTRHLCLEWMRSHGYPEPPRSACVYCPFHGNAEWRRLQLNEPEDFKKAVQFERDIQAAKQRPDNFGATPFLHRSCKPLDQIDFASDEERGQLTLWQDECEGMCGV